VVRVAYVATLHKATRKEHVCQRCKRVIRRGEFYVSYHELGMGTCYWALDYKYCVECARGEVVRMLKYGVKKLGGQGFWYPVPDAPMPDEWREELLEILGEEGVEEIVEGVESLRRERRCFGGFDPRNVKCWSCPPADRDRCRLLAKNLPSILSRWSNV
jgi:hypothetical protein